MGIKGLPGSYDAWLLMRKEHLEKNLEKSHYTTDLYKQYRKHLGAIRYKILLESQALVVPQKVNMLLKLGNFSLLKPLIKIYKISRKIKADWFLKSLILPTQYKQQIKDLDIHPV